ncbi:type III pantothenate kinase [Acutalibacter intestini]|uniref:type III pantothenate kinase n=1 Tax=Acutalibacter intestini TaxID=3093659 RepID=UPI002AC97895|nr:type III pantothenate kinase [Acutalibacter sp. M00204]
MILTIDIGNTNTVLGCWRDGKLILTLRLHTNRDQTADEYCLLIGNLLKSRDVNPKELSGGILSSVVPELRMVMKKAMELLTGKTFLCVGAGLKTGLNIRMDNPAQLGADLVVDAIASLHKYQPPLVIFDMGTATTMSVIDSTGAYLGGMIIPGLRLSVDALSARAAQLPYIHLGPPERFIGSNTIDCMQAGAVYGSALMIDGLIARAEEELGQPVTAVATGGLMALIHPYCRRPLHYDENLMLEGLYLLYKKNVKSK